MAAFSQARPHLPLTRFRHRSQCPQHIQPGDAPSRVGAEQPGEGCRTALPTAAVKRLGRKARRRAKRKGGKAGTPSTGLVQPLSRSTRPDSLDAPRALSRLTTPLRPRRARSGQCYLCSLGGTVMMLVSTSTRCRQKTLAQESIAAGVKIGHPPKAADNWTRRLRFNGKVPLRVVRMENTSDSENEVGQERHQKASDTAEKK